MTESNQNTSGGSDQSAASGGTGDSGGTKDTVAYSTHEKLLSEKKKLAEKMVAAEAELAKFRDAEAEKQRKDLEAKGEYEKLITQEREARAAAEAKLKETESTINARRKLAAILDSVDGKIESKYFGLVNIDDVIIDPTTGEVDQMSVTKAVEKFKKEFPEVIQTGRVGMPNTAATGGAGAAKRIHFDQFRKLSSKEQAKYSMDMIDGL